MTDKLASGAETDALPWLPAALGERVCREGQEGLSSPASKIISIFWRRNWWYLERTRDKRLVCKLENASPAELGTEVAFARLLGG